MLSKLLLYNIHILPTIQLRRRVNLNAEVIFLDFFKIKIAQQLRLYRLSEILRTYNQKYRDHNGRARRSLLARSQHLFTIII